MKLSSPITQSTWSRQHSCGPVGRRRWKVQHLKFSQFLNANVRPCTGAGSRLRWRIFSHFLLGIFVDGINKKLGLYYFNVYQLRKTLIGVRRRFQGKMKGHTRSTQGLEARSVICGTLNLHFPLTHFRQPSSRSMLMLVQVVEAGVPGASADKLRRFSYLFLLLW